MFDERAVELAKRWRATGPGWQGAPSTPCAERANRGGLGAASSKRRRAGHAVVPGAPTRRHDGGAALPMTCAGIARRERSASFARSAADAARETRRGAGCSKLGERRSRRRLVVHRSRRAGVVVVRRASATLANAAALMRRRQGERDAEPIPRGGTAAVGRLDGPRPPTVARRASAQLAVAQPSIAEINGARAAARSPASAPVARTRSAAGHTRRNARRRAGATRARSAAHRRRSAGARAPRRRSTPRRPRAAPAAALEGATFGIMSRSCNSERHIDAAAADLCGCREQARAPLNATSPAPAPASRRRWAARRSRARARRARRPACGTRTGRARPAGGRRQPPRSRARLVGPALGAGRLVELAFTARACDAFVRRHRLRGRLLRKREMVGLGMALPKLAGVSTARLCEQSSG